jgi:hypothetical protein
MYDEGQAPCYRCRCPLLAPRSRSPARLAVGGPSPQIPKGSSRRSGRSRSRTKTGVDKKEWLVADQKGSPIAQTVGRRTSNSFFALRSPVLTTCYTSDDRRWHTPRRNTKGVSRTLAPEEGVCSKAISHSPSWLSTFSTPGPPLRGRVQIGPLRLLVGVFPIGVFLSHRIKDG